MGWPPPVGIDVPGLDLRKKKIGSSARIGERGCVGLGHRQHRLIRVTDAKHVAITTWAQRPEQRRTRLTERGHLAIGVVIGRFHLRLVLQRQRTKMLHPHDQRINLLAGFLDFAGDANAVALGPARRDIKSPIFSGRTQAAYGPAMIDMQPRDRSNDDDVAVTRLQMARIRIGRQFGIVSSDRTKRFNGYLCCHSGGTVT